MKKLLIILLLFSINIFANSNYELKLYEKVLPIIFDIKYPVVYADSHTKEILKNSKIFTLTNNCNEVDFMMGKNLIDLNSNCNNKPIFATSYRGFKNMQNSFGAFYWRKGRPQIKFKQDIIIKFNLYIPQTLRKYVK